MTVSVGINGYGTIGKRIADAVDAQPDMTLVGVAKTRPDFAASMATDRGRSLYVAGEHRERFVEERVPFEGDVADLVAESDVVVDATPGGVGAENRPLYVRNDTPAIFQGGETADVADVSFNARANFEEAAGGEYVRVVSCNTTGLSRLIAPLEENYGIEKVRATLIRRGGDPGQPSRGPIDDILPNVTVPSHHGHDVQTVFPSVAVDTTAVTVPATHMHVHSVNVTLDRSPTPGAVRSLLEGESRIVMVEEEMGLVGCGALQELAKDAGRPRGDLPENVVWRESVTVRDRDLYLLQAIHQESNVVPENVDAIRAVAGVASASRSVRTTDRTLDIGSVWDRNGRTVVESATD